MKKLSDMLGESIGRPEVLRASRAQRVLREWADIVGEQLAQRCVPDRYVRGTLWIAASGNAWAQELRFQAETILARLNERAGEELFTSLRIGTRPPRRDWDSVDDLYQ